MATYAIGDVHGCHATLQRLLGEIAFNGNRDRLWLVGDLVNRGPGSLALLRWARELGERLTMVLGNHEIHLIGRALGARPARRFDRFDEVLAAPDRDELIDWLRHRPLLHRDGEFLLVHAGLDPHWTVAGAEQIARQIEEQLRSPGCEPLLRDYYDNPAQPRTRGLRNLVHMRTCRDDGSECRFTGPPDEAPDGCLPWYERFDDRTWSGTTIFGHWAALGYRRTDRILALDSGCAWGGQLTAVCLDDGAVTQVPLIDPVEGVRG